MTTPSDDILQFPCEFPLRIIGRNEDDFENFAFEFMREFVPDLMAETIRSRLSHGGTYLSVTMTFTAQSREQVDSIYQAMSGHERILFAL
jgi:putative lipoic acid-binding regulatory protein